MIEANIEAIKSQYIKGIRHGLEDFVILIFDLEDPHGRELMVGYEKMWGREPDVDKLIHDHRSKGLPVLAALPKERTVVAGWFKGGNSDLVEGLAKPLPKDSVGVVTISNGISYKSISRVSLGVVINGSVTELRDMALMINSGLPKKQSPRNYRTQNDAPSKFLLRMLVAMLLIILVLLALLAWLATKWLAD